MEKDILSKGNHKKAGVAIPISDKIDFKIKTVTRDKGGHYIMIKKRYNNCKYIYTQQRCILIYICYKMLRAVKGAIDSKTTIVGALTLHLHQWTDHPDRKSIRKHMR